MSKKVFISQSNYIPWKGYLDSIAMADEYVIYDDMQYTRRDWRNRNQIKTPVGLKWLTIPVEVKGKYFQKINETKVSDKKWAMDHWKTITANYAKSKCFKEYKDIFENLYLNINTEWLTEINYIFLTEISKILNINTIFHFSSSFKLHEDVTQRLVNICMDLNATNYISGPAAKAYINEEFFKNENIQIEYMDYSGYKEYSQLYPPFQHGVSILDLIFSEGSDSINYLKFKNNENFTAG